MGVYYSLTVLAFIVYLILIISIFLGRYAVNYSKNRAIAKNTKFPHRILLSFGTWSDFRRIGSNS